MGLLERAGRYLFPAPHETAHAVAAVTEAWAKGTLSADALFRRGLETQIQMGKVTDPYRQVSAVYVAIARKAQSAASVEWSLVKRKRVGPRMESEVVEEHALYDLLAHPNEATVGNQLFEATYSLLELRGKAFWLADGVTGMTERRPTRVTLLRGDVKAKTSKSGEIAEWVETDTGSGAKRSHSPDDIVPFMYFHPEDPYDGMAPLEAARLGYQLAWASQSGQERFYRNGAMPPFYVKHTGDIAPTTEDRKVVRKEFEQNYTGLRRWWRVPIMFKGFELASIAVNQRDAEWIATQNLTMKQILSVFGVPPSVAGFTEDANRSISDSELRVFWGGTIRTVGELVAASVQTHLVEKFWPGLEFSYDWQGKFAEVMPEELRKGVASAHIMVTDGIPPVQAYRLHGIDLDTSEAPHLEVGWLPMSVAPAEVLLEQPATAPAEDEPPEDEDEQDDEQDDDEQDAALYSPGRGRRASRVKYERVLYSLERRALGDWRGFLTWYERQVLSETKAGWRVPASEVPVRTTRAASNKDIDAQAVKAMKGVVKAAAKAGWKVTASEVPGLSVNFNDVDPAVRAALERREQSIVGASRTVQERIRETIAEGIEARETPVEMAQRVKTFFRGERIGKARVIARQETAAAFNEVRWVAITEAKVWGTEWSTASDEFVRASHEALEGQVRALGDTFSNGLTYPLDPAGAPDEVIGCRCVVIPIVKEP